MGEKLNYPFKSLKTKYNLRYYERKKKKGKGFWGRLRFFSSSFI